MKKVMMIIGFVSLTSPALAENKQCILQQDGANVVYRVREGQTIRPMTFAELFTFMKASSQPRARVLEVVNAASIEVRENGNVAYIESFNSVPADVTGRSNPRSAVYERRLREAGAERGFASEVTLAVPLPARDANETDFNAQKAKILALSRTLNCTAPRVDEAPVADATPAPEPQAVARPEGVGPNENAIPRANPPPEGPVAPADDSASGQAVAAIR